MIFWMLGSCAMPLHHWVKALRCNAKHCWEKKEACKLQEHAVSRVSRSLRVANERNPFTGHCCFDPPTPHPSSHSPLGVHHHPTMSVDRCLLPVPTRHHGDASAPPGDLRVAARLGQGLNVDLTQRRRGRGHGVCLVALEAGLAGLGDAELPSLLPHLVTLLLQPAPPMRNVQKN